MKNFSINLEDSDLDNSFLNRKLWVFISYVSVVILIVIFFAIAKSAYKYNTFPTSIDEIPLYKDELTPYRSKPSDPGGEIYENQDKLVYQNLVEKQKAKPKPAKKVEKPKKKKNINNPFEMLNND